MGLAGHLLAVLALALATAGCRLVDAQPKGRSPLAPLATGEHPLTLEIFSAPVAVDDPRLAALWAEVDEQPLAPELRRKLNENGIRPGVAGPQVPGPLAELLKVTDAPISTEERSLVPLEAEPGPQLHVLEPRPGKRNDLVVSGVCEQVSVLKSSEGQLEGRTYPKAEARLQLRVFPEPDARVRLELLPELHYGELKTHITGSGSEGMMIFKPERPKHTYVDLKMSAALAPGQMFLMTCSADKPSSIGHCFFTQHGAEKPTQKLWVIRFAQAGADRSFAETPRPAEELVSGDDTD